MKKIFVFRTALIFLSCAPTEIDEKASSPVVSLTVGNKYVYFHSSYNPPYYLSFWNSDTITNSVFIGSEIWYQFNTMFYRRADAKKLYRLQDGSSIVELDFTVSIGDTIVFDDMRVAVINICQEDVLGTQQRVIRISNEGFESDTIFIVSYATKFGLISSYKRIGNHSSSLRLVSALIEGKKYGDISFLTN